MTPLSECTTGFAVVAPDQEMTVVAVAAVSVFKLAFRQSQSRR